MKYTKGLDLRTVLELHKESQRVELQIQGMTAGGTHFLDGSTHIPPITKRSGKIPFWVIYHVWGQVRQQMGLLSIYI